MLLVMIRDFDSKDLRREIASMEIGRIGPLSRAGIAVLLLNAVSFVLDESIERCRT